MKTLLINILLKLGYDKLTEWYNAARLRRHLSKAAKRAVKMKANPVILQRIDDALEAYYDDQEDIPRPTKRKATTLILVSLIGSTLLCGCVLLPDGATIDDIVITVGDTLGLPQEPFQKMKIRRGRLNLPPLLLMLMSRPRLLLNRKNQNKRQATSQPLRLTLTMARIGRLSLMASSSSRPGRTVSLERAGLGMGLTSSGFAQTRACTSGCMRTASHSQRLMSVMVTQYLANTQTRTITRSARNWSAKYAATARSTSLRCDIE